MIVGLINVYYDTARKGALDTKAKIRLFLLVPIGILVLPFMALNAFSISRDVALHEFGGAPLRVVPATITERAGFPGAFIFADRITLNNTMDVTLPYSDLPQVGARYTFTLLPTENVVVYYQ
jgi:hypothetical protein